MILSRVRILPQQRYDLEDFYAQQSAGRTDSKLWTKQFLTDKNSILKGFVVTGIGFNQATVVVSDSTLIIPENTADFSWFTVAPGSSNLTIPDSALVDGSRNYVELKLATETGTPIVKSFWDPSANGGAGAEFNQLIDTMFDLDAQVEVSTGGFSGSPDRLPLAIIDVDNSGVIKVILDRRDLFFRLSNPSDIDEGFTWASQTEPGYNMTLSGVTGTFTPGELLQIGSVTAQLVSGTTSPLIFNCPDGISFSSGDFVTGLSSGATGTVNSIYESFSGADKDIDNVQESLKALMTEIRALKGTRFWFENSITSTTGAFRFLNAILVQNSAGAKIKWTGTNLSITDDSGSPGASDVVGKLRIFGSSQELDICRESIAVNDNEVVYIEVPTSGNKTFDGAEYKVTSLSSFIRNDSNFWIAYRKGAKIYVNGLGELEPGESEEIGDNIPQEIIDSISVGNSLYLTSDDNVEWSGTQLAFAEPIVLEYLNPKSGVLTTHTIPTSESPISISDGDSIYVMVDRTVASETLTVYKNSVTPISGQDKVSKEAIVLFRRLDNPATASKELYLPFSKQFMSEGQVSRLGASGSGSGAGGFKITAYDPTSTALPTGAGVTTDGVTLANGALVLFSNLSVDNNRVYRLSGVGTSIAWAPVRAFQNGSYTPFDGDRVLILEGTLFSDQTAIYNGTEFKINDVVRYFNGTDYWQQESLKNTTLLDAQGSLTNVFSVVAAGSENMIVEFSLVRGSTKEIGSLFITHDGINTSLTKTSTLVGGAPGIDFDADIDSGNLRVRYQSTATGDDADFKFIIKRWSDSPGGPSGVPSYASVGGSSTTAGGLNKQVQFNNAGLLAGDASFEWDNTSKTLSLGDLDIQAITGPITLNDNQVIPATFLSLDASLFKHAVVEYSANMNGVFRTGRLLMVCDGSVAFATDDFVETGSSGINLSATLSAGNILFQYTTALTGVSGELKLSIRKWL